MRFYGISNLAHTDADLFRRAFREEPTYYCNSWLYILRSARADQGNPGYKFVGKDALIAIGYRDQTVYLVHPLGKNRFVETLALCQEFHDSMRCPIILKKIDPELYAYLRSSELFQKQRYAPISYDETFLKYPGTMLLLEEEAFPEHTLHLNDLYGSVAGAYHPSDSFIRKVKRFEKNAVTLLSSNDCMNIENMSGFSTLFADHSEKYESYLQMIREVNSHDERDNRYQICTYYDAYKTLHGLYISETFSDGNMGLYCAVSSKAFPGITEWMDYHFFQQLYQDGIQYLYLGGSETSGVDAYVKKLFPSTPPYLLRHMQLNGGTGFSSEAHTD